MRKLMMLHKALHLKDNVDRMYVTIKGGRGLTSTEECVDVATRDLKNI